MAGYGFAKSTLLLDLAFGYGPSSFGTQGFDFALPRLSHLLPPIYLPVNRKPT
jgi:hypothetical protein